MDEKHFTLRLKETSGPPGEIPLRDLADLSTHLQRLATRVARWSADIEGAGRSPALVKQASDLRLSAIRPGSTVLDIAPAATGQLPFATPFEVDFQDRFWEMITAIGSDTPPADAPAVVRQSARRLLEALGQAAGEVEVTRADGKHVAFRPGDCHREVWDTSPAVAESELVTVSGIVEMVDLGTRRFRLRDDVGNGITLDDVMNPRDASQLVGSRADAVGQPARDPGGRLTAVTSVHVTAAQIPTEWMAPVHNESWRELAAQNGPDPDGGVDFDDDEWAEFLAAVRGQ